MRTKLEILFSVVVVLAAAWVVWQAATVWGRRSGLFPLVVGVPVLVLATVQLAMDVRGARRSRSSGIWDLSDVDLPPAAVRQRTAVIAGATVAFAVGIWLLGFVVAVPLVTFLYLKVAARESWRMSLGLAAAAGLSFYVLFVYMLNVPAPHGPLITLFLE